MIPSRPSAGCGTPRPPHRPHRPLVGTLPPPGPGRRRPARRRRSEVDLAGPQPFVRDPARPCQVGDEQQRCRDQPEHDPTQYVGSSPTSARTPVPGRFPELGSVGSVPGVRRRAGQRGAQAGRVISSRAPSCGGSQGARARADADADAVAGAAAGDAARRSSRSQPPRSRCRPSGSGAPQRSSL